MEYCHLKLLILTIRIRYSRDPLANRKLSTDKNRIILQFFFNNKLNQSMFYKNYLINMVISLGTKNNQIFHLKE